MAETTQVISRVVDLTDPAANQIFDMSVDAARERVRMGLPAGVREIAGSFALVATAGTTVRLARSMDRPLRYFLAKRQAGPVLIVADRIDAIRDWLVAEGLGEQFHPSYTRMVPAHHVVELQVIGCPDPDPTYVRFFEPRRNALAADVDDIGRAYVGALADAIAQWLRAVPEREPVGVCFSGGVDSGAVLLTTYHVMRKLGMRLGRLKAFTLDCGGGADLGQARVFLETLGLGLLLEAIESEAAALDVGEAIRVVEDYKALDIDCAAVGLALGRGIRARYPDWRYLLDGDGGDENLKDYPIEENAELTIGSVLNNSMLYQEGWGVGKIKHSLTYSGGLSRSYARTYAPARHHGFRSFSPFTRPGVIEVAEGIPFAELTAHDVDRLYGLKGAIVASGVEAITGLRMPVFPKRRFQDGALASSLREARPPSREAEYRRRFLAMYC